MSFESIKSHEDARRLSNGLLSSDSSDINESILKPKLKMLSHQQKQVSSGQWLYQRFLLTLPLIVGVRGNRLIWTCLNLGWLALQSWVWGMELGAPPPEVVVPVLLVNLIFIWLLNPDSPRSLSDLGIL